MSSRCGRWQPANQGMFKPETETLTHETEALQTSSSSSDNGANSILRVYGHIRPKTVWTRDTSAPVPKCLRTVRYQDISALRHFGLRAETVRTIGPDTIVLGPGHFSTTSNTYAGKSASNRCNTQAKCFLQPSNAFHLFVVFVVVPE